MQFEASESAIALVGMAGLRLLAAAEVDGELHQLMETTATVVGCGGCGTRRRAAVTFAYATCPPADGRS